MATSERWDLLYEARKEKARLLEAVQLADLYVVCWNTMLPGHDRSTGADNQKGFELLNEGSRLVPFALGFAGLDTKAKKNTDPRQIPGWAAMAAKYPGPALEQLAQTYPDAVTIGPGGAATGYNPSVIVPPEFSPDSYNFVGEYYSGSGDNSYWTNEEVTQERHFNELYTRAYVNALSWWLLLHNQNPGSFLDYEQDLINVLNQINISESGDPVQDLILDSVYPDAPGNFDPGLSPYSAGVTPTQAGMMGPLLEYWPYAAAAGAVLFLLNKRKKRTT